MYSLSFQDSSKSLFSPKVTSLGLTAVNVLCEFPRLNFRLGSRRGYESQLQSTGQCSGWVGSGGPAAAWTLQGAAATPGLQSSHAAAPASPSTPGTRIYPPAGLLASSMQRPGSGPEAPSPWAQPGQAVWALPSSPPWGVHAIPPPKCLPGLLDSPCTTVCVSGPLNWPPWALGSLLKGEGGPISHTFSLHIANSPYNVDMYLMVRGPNMALTSHHSVSMIQMRVSALRSAKLQSYSRPPKKRASG